MRSSTLDATAVGMSGRGRRFLSPRARRLLTASPGLVLGLLLVLPLGGCSASRTQDRLNVVQAENADLMQREQLAQQRAAEIQMGRDRAAAELQAERAAAAQLRDQAEEGRLAAEALARSTAKQEQQVREMQRLGSELAALEGKLDARPVYTPPAPAPAPDLRRRASPQLGALRRDLEAKFREFGIEGLTVEERMATDGGKRIAVVLTNAFPAGKDSLSYNMDAVRAVVNLGRLISTNYPGSRVAVEGHTDSDPILSSPWPSNQALGLARAEAVRDLLQKAGVSSGQIETEGVGPVRPLAAGNTPRAKAQNRRVEIYIEPSA